MQKLNNKINNWINIAVLFLLTLNYLFYSFFDLGHLRNYVRLLVSAMLVFMLAFQLLENRFKRRHVVLLLFAAYQIFVGGTNSLNIAFLVLIVLTMREDENKTVFRQAFAVLAVFAVVVILCLALGIEKNYNYISDVDDSRERNTLGFVNVNGAGIFAFSLEAAYLLSRQKVKWLHLGIVAVAAVVMYRLTDSRTPFLGIVIMMVLWLVLPVIPRKWAKCCLWVGIGLLFVTPAVWPLPFVNSEPGNFVLSSRPEFFSSYMEQQSIVTFIFGGSRVAEIDNGYLLLLYNCGVIVYLAIALAVAKASETMLEKGKFMELAFLSAMLVCAVFEGSFLRPELLCAPLLWGIVFDNIGWGEGDSSLVGKIRRFFPTAQEKPGQ